MVLLNVDSFAAPANFAATPSGTVASGGSSGGDQQSAGTFGDQLQQALQTSSATSSQSDVTPPVPVDQLQLSDSSAGTTNPGDPSAASQAAHGNPSSSAPSDPAAASSPANAAAAPSTNAAGGTPASQASDTPADTTLSAGQNSKSQPATKDQISNCLQQLGIGSQWQPPVAISPVEQQQPAATQPTVVAQLAQSSADITPANTTPANTVPANTVPANTTPVDSTPVNSTPAAGPVTSSLALNALASQNAVATQDPVATQSNTGTGKLGAAQNATGTQTAAAPQAAATPETTVATVQPAASGRALSATATTVSVSVPQNPSAAPTPVGTVNTTTTATTSSATTTTAVTAAQPAPANEKHASGADQSQMTASLTAPPAAIAAQFSSPLAVANATALTAATTTVAVSALNQSAPAVAADSKSDKGSGATGHDGSATPPSSATAASAAAQSQSSITGSPANTANISGFQAAMSGTNHSQSGYGTGGTDAARFVQRVANAFQALGNQSGSLKLRLSPPDLGALHVEVRIDQGQLTAHLQAETPEARTMLLDNLPALRERLEQQDIKVARFDVDLMGQSSGGLPNTPNRDAWAGYNTQTGGANRTAAATSVDASQSGSTGSQAVIGDSQLNVVI